MVKLRGHHLICLCFFKGEGYSENFIKKIYKALSEDVEVVDGLDDICIECPYLLNNECHYKEGSDEEIRKLDELALYLLKVSKGDILSWDEIRKRVEKILTKWRELSCRNCDWLTVCEHA